MTEKIPSVRESFVARFGEGNAAAIEAAARGHKNGVHDNLGSDPFKWALLIAIGHECMGRYASDHGITVAESDIQAWAVEHGDLGAHDGDCDYIALICGTYDAWLPAEVSA
jgi:hypothetical protein